MDRRDEAAIEAVKAYYQQDLSQAEVAARMGISRPTVAKLLAHGRARGFVTVEIHDPREEASELALRLQERFALACVRVAHGCVADEAEAISQVGRVGAELVARLVRDDMSVGISWGRTMSAVASHLARSPRQGVRVVQLKGGTSFSDRATHDFEIMRAFCDAFGAEPSYLPLPVIFEDTATASIVRADRGIERILREGRGVDIAVFTVGAVKKESLSLNLGQLEPGEGEALASSAKDLREHDLASESVSSILTQLCSSVTTQGPFLLSLPNVVHLATDVHARLGSAHLLDLVAALHPTAAVCGTPRDAAMRLIEELEDTERGRYSGPVGWVDPAGNGEFAIALRCGLTSGTRLRLFAGAGIMPDSDPDAELAETEAKMRPLLDALGV